MNENTNLRPEVLLQQMDEVAERAIKDLAKYKFWMFDYWASKWVTLNRLAKDMGVLQKSRPSPFSEFVNLAREIRSRGESK